MKITFIIERQHYVNTNYARVSPPRLCTLPPASPASPTYHTSPNFAVIHPPRFSSTPIYETKNDRALKKFVGH